MTTFSTAEIPCASPVNPIWQLCSRCHGIAAISAIYYTPTGAVLGRMPCDACKGSKRQQCTIADAKQSKIIQASYNVTDSTNTTELYLVLLMAPSFQGGHSEVGAKVAKYLGIPFPLEMHALYQAARKRGFDPDALWPWRAKMQAERAAMENLNAE